MSERLILNGIRRGGKDVAGFISSKTERNIVAMLELTTEEVIQSYVQLLGDSEKWRTAIVLDARQVLVPAATLHERVLARFDPVTFDRLMWKRMPNERGPSALESFLVVNKGKNDAIRRELKIGNTAKKPGLSV
jgi:hypothetical protein